MDELYSEIQLFIRMLDSFNQATGQNWDNLQRVWREADKLWDQGDATRREFENQWRDMGEALRIYRQQHGDRYLEFLLRRKRALDDYFGGGW